MAMSANMAHTTTTTTSSVRRYFPHQCKHIPSGFDCAGCACDDSGYYCACDECIFIPASEGTASMCQRPENSAMWLHY